MDGHNNLGSLVDNPKAYLFVETVNEKIAENKNLFTNVSNVFSLVYNTVIPVSFCAQNFHLMRQNGQSPIFSIY